MTRPQPKILLRKEYPDQASTEILAAESLYAVVYKLEPINIKQQYYSMSGLGHKYPKSVFPSPAPAKNLATKLNTEFNTTDFTVKQVL